MYRKPINCYTNIGDGMKLMVGGDYTRAYVVVLKLKNSFIY